MGQDKVTGKFTKDSPAEQKVYGIIYVNPYVSGADKMGDWWTVDQVVWNTTSKALACVQADKLARMLGGEWIVQEMNNWLSKHPIRTE